MFIASSLIGLLHGGHGVDIAVEELRTEGDLAGTVALLPLLGAEHTPVGRLWKRPERR